MPAARVAKRGFSRAGSALCGVRGFEQHLGLWPALLGGVGWLLASDHAGYLLRRCYAARIRARLAPWPTKGPTRRRLIAALHALIGDPRRDRADSYPVFALVNAASALIWGSAFVGAGYSLAARSHGGETNLTSVALTLTATAVILAYLLSRTISLHTDTARRRNLGNRALGIAASAPPTRSRRRRGGSGDPTVTAPVDSTG